jgi:hypothetical protein
MLSLKSARICREVSSALFLMLPISPNILLILLSRIKALLLGLRGEFVGNE